MKESIGKGVARDLFYRHCLPQWLSLEQIRSGNFLVLLGNGNREIKLLDSLGVPRWRVFSVERRFDVYKAQQAQKLHVSLYRGELHQFLREHLHTDQRFLVLNLDIEGTYLGGIDPALSSVLLFCWRNPETVVATYSSIGRDLSSLREGVKSLALFFALAPEETDEFVTNVIGRYDTAALHCDEGFSKPVRLMLRDLLWLRSHMEHALLSTMCINNAIGQIAQFFLWMENLWSAFQATRRGPIRISTIRHRIVHLTRAGAAQALPINDLPMIGIQPTELMNVIYQAEKPWTQRCYFAKFNVPPEPINTIDWLTHFLRLFRARPFMLVNRAGERSNIEDAAQRRTNYIIWKKSDIFTFHPKKITLPRDSTALRESIVTINERARRNEDNDQTEEDFMSKKPGAPKTGSHADDGEDDPKTRNGQLTENGKLFIRELAQLDPPLTADDIIASAAELARVQRQTIIAHIAVARRKPKTCGRKGEK